MKHTFVYKRSLKNNGYCVCDSKTVLFKFGQHIDMSFIDSDVFYRKPVTESPFFLFTRGIIGTIDMTEIVY